MSTLVNSKTRRSPSKAPRSRRPKAAIAAPSRKPRRVSAPDGSAQKRVRRELKKTVKRQNRDLSVDVTLTAPCVENHDDSATGAMPLTMAGASSVEPTVVMQPVRRNNEAAYVTVNGQRVRVYAKTMQELLEDETLLEPDRFIVPYFAAAGYVTLLAAREKRGKSTIAAAIATAVTRGGDFLGGKVVQGRVLWVGLEETRKQAIRRFKAMGTNDKNLAFIDRLNGDGGLQQLLAEIEFVKPTLVVLDSLAAFTKGGEDENSAAACTAMLTPLVHYVHETGTSLIILHHANKAGTGYRGATAIGASVDMILEMGEGESKFHRQIRARSRLEVDDFGVVYDRPSHSYKLADAEPSEEDKRAELVEKVFATIRDNPGLGKYQIRERAGVAGVKTDSAITTLVDSERVKYLGRKGGYVVADPDKLKFAVE